MSAYNAIALIKGMITESNDQEVTKILLAAASEIINLGTKGKKSSQSVLPESKKKKTTTAKTPEDRMVDIPKEYRDATKCEFDMTDEVFCYVSRNNCGKLLKVGGLFFKILPFGSDIPKNSLYFKSFNRHHQVQYVMLDEDIKMTTKMYFTACGDIAKAATKDQKSAATVKELIEREPKIFLHAINGEGKPTPGFNCEEYGINYYVGHNQRVAQQRELKQSEATVEDRDNSKSVKFSSKEKVIEKEVGSAEEHQAERDKDVVVVETTLEEENDPEDMTEGDDDVIPETETTMTQQQKLDKMMSQLKTEI